MRLLNTTTLELQEFPEGNEPSYAVLSHAWDGQEVSYVDYKENRRLDGYGYQTITRFCETAKTWGVQWAFIHSCCVDNGNAAEVEQAIHSTFDRFKRAYLCFVLLADVRPSGTGDIARLNRTTKQDILQSRWFTRSWTLPELLAPPQIVFVDREWHPIGFKGGGTRVNKLNNLNDTISTITGIPIKSLTYFHPSDANVSELLDWAQNRESAKVEDVVYSLLSLLGIKMPIMYAEGTRAFERLKSEVMRLYGPVEDDERTKPQFKASASESGYDEPLRRRALRRNRVSPTDWKYELTENGLVLRDQISKPTQRDEISDGHTHEDEGSQRNTVNLASSGMHQSRLTLRDTSTMVARTQAANQSEFIWKTCWSIVAAGVIVVAGSLFAVLYYSFAKHQMSAGATLGSYVIAVGGLLLLIPITQHYPRCTCWSQETSDGGLEAEMHHMYR